MPLRVVFVPFFFLFWPRVQFSCGVITYTETRHSSSDTPSPAAKRHRHTLMCPPLSRHIHRAHLDRSLPGHKLSDHTLVMRCFVFTCPKRILRQLRSRHPLMWCQVFFFFLFSFQTHLSCWPQLCCSSGDQRTTRLRWGTLQMLKQTEPSQGGSC